MQLLSGAVSGVCQTTRVKSGLPEEWPARPARAVFACPDPSKHYLARCRRVLFLRRTRRLEMKGESWAEARHAALCRTDIQLNQYMSRFRNGGPLTAIPRPQSGKVGWLAGCETIVPEDVSE